MTRGQRLPRSLQTLERAPLNLVRSVCVLVIPHLWQPLCEPSLSQPRWLPV